LFCLEHRIGYVHIIMPEAIYDQHNDLENIFIDEAGAAFL
jgi:hypothetical protein